MNDLPNNLKYTAEHEWVKLTEENEAVIGITYFAQENVGDITFIELSQIGSTLKRGETFGAVESVKTASDLYMPISGTIKAINSELEETPELVNASPFEDGWMLKIALDNPQETNTLLDVDEYSQIIESQI